MKKVHHLAAVVRDMEKILEFYCEALGATLAWDGKHEIQEGSQTDTIFQISNCQVWVAGLNLHGTIIEFFQFLQPKSSDYSPRKDTYQSLGWSHVALQVDDIHLDLKKAYLLRNILVSSC